MSIITEDTGNSMSVESISGNFVFLHDGYSFLRLWRLPVLSERILSLLATLSRDSVSFAFSGVLAVVPNENLFLVVSTEKAFLEALDMDMPGKACLIVDDTDSDYIEQQEVIAELKSLLFPEKVEEVHNG